MIKRFLNLFATSKPADSAYFHDATNLYKRVWTPVILREFLEEYARATTERETEMHLNSKTPAPTYQTYHEIQKLLKFIDQI